MRDSAPELELTLDRQKHVDFLHEALTKSGLGILRPSARLAIEMGLPLRTAARVERDAVSILRPDTFIEETRDAGREGGALHEETDLTIDLGRARIEVLTANKGLGSINDKGLGVNADHGVLGGWCNIGMGCC